MAMGTVNSMPTTQAAYRPAANRNPDLPPQHQVGRGVQHDIHHAQTVLEVGILLLEFDQATNHPLEEAQGARANAVLRGFFVALE
jgi:hypothetical protein